MTPSPVRRAAEQQEVMAAIAAERSGDMDTKKWVLDVTYSMPAFCPYKDDGTIITGLSVISNECPGEFVGVIHLDGQEAVEKWLAEHPDWEKEYKLHD